MTATITPITRRALPDPTGTDFVQRVDADGNTNAFEAREPGSGDLAFSPIGDSPTIDWDVQRRTNARVLRELGIQVLAEPRMTDPNVRYAKDVHHAILSALEDAGQISTEDSDTLTMALDIAVEYGANAVAAA
jgi:hypothetical protein